MPWSDSNWRIGLPHGIAARIAFAIMILLAGAGGWVLFSVEWDPANSGDVAQQYRLWAGLVASSVSALLMLIRERRRSRRQRSIPEIPVLPWWADPLGTASFDGVVTLDDKALIRSVNYGAEELFGYSARELMGRSLFKIVPADSNFSGAEKLADADNQRDGIHLNVTGRTKDGGTFPLELRLTRFQRGSRAMYFGVCRRRHREEAGSAPAWSAADSWAERFMARIGQDVNRAATTIQGFAEVVMERLPPTDPLRSDVAEIGATGEQIAQLSQALQIVARIRGGGARTALHPWLTEFGNRFEGTFGRGRTIGLQLAANDPMVLAQPAFLQVVMVYLLKGIGTGRNGGTAVQIGTRDDSASQRVIVEVSGAEPGRAPDSLPFEVVRAFLAKNGGDLEIAGQPEGGVIFRLRFPLVGVK